jgi:hypothetical protein
MAQGTKLVAEETQAAPGVPRSSEREERSPGMAAAMTVSEENRRDHRQIRAAVNQTTFREINESLEKLNHDLSDVIPIGDFVCECADINCTARIGLTIEEYEQVRAAPTHFAVRHGHIIPGAERIVEARVGYMIVEKIGAAAEYAASVNPRALIG